MNSYYLLMRCVDGEIASDDRLLNNDSDATLWASYVREGIGSVREWQLYAIGGTQPRLVTQGDSR